jgi:hypothetical protein
VTGHPGPVTGHPGPVTGHPGPVPPHRSAGGPERTSNTVAGVNPGLSAMPNRGPLAPSNQAWAAHRSPVPRGLRPITTTPGARRSRSIT